MTEKIWSAEDYFNKAKEFEAQDKLDEAIYFYTETIESDSGMKKAYSSRAEVFFQEKDYKNALIDYEYLDSLENDEKYLEKRAICYERMRDYGKSLELYKIAAARY